MNTIILSFICATNDLETLNSMLVTSLKKQNNQNFELIVVDAKEHGFNSASETLNYGASLAKGKYLCFIHQDIEFLGDDAVSKIIQFCDDNEFGIAGLAGVVGNGKTRADCQVYSSVLFDKDRHQAGVAIDDVKIVLAVDECVMFVKKDDFMKFDDYGATWHFYGVEYSLRCLEENKNVLVFPINIYHKSAGVLNNSYWDTLLKVAKKHKNVKRINTCCGIFKNNALLPTYCFLHKIKNKLTGRK